MGDKKNKNDLNRSGSRLKGVLLAAFQSIKEPIYFEFSGITLFYGPNSAGKSALIDALRFLRLLTRAEQNSYRAEYLWSKYCSGNKSTDTRIGASFAVGDFMHYKDDIEVHSWLNRRGEFGEQPHTEMFEELAGHSIQAEFTGWDGCHLRIAVDGEPLVELDGWNKTLFTRDYKRTKKEEESLSYIDDRQRLTGSVTIYKENKFSDIFITGIGASEAVRAGYADCHMRGIFIEEGLKTLRFNGIDLREGLRPGGKLEVGVCFDADNVLFPKYTNSINSDTNFDAKSRKFIIKHFVKKTDFRDRQEKGRRAIWNFLCGVAAELDQFVQGVILQLKHSIEFSHVDGDRGIFDSDDPAFISKGSRLSRSIKIPQPHPSVSLYAHAATFGFKDLGFDFVNVIQSDFVNDSFKRYILSISRYEIAPEVHCVKPIESTRQRRDHWPASWYAAGRWHNVDDEYFVCYLNVKSPSGQILGLQEVGSGISYVLPILTSLWASTMTIVEQPELHLHPASQCEMGDVFISALNEGSFSIVESHSEHLLLRLLRRIREASSNNNSDPRLRLIPNQLSIYYFHPSTSGDTLVRRIRVDKFGEFMDEWPNGFFAERDQELFG